MIVWQAVQLAFWLSVIALIVVGFAVCVFAPPYFAGRALYRRLR